MRYMVVYRTPRHWAAVESVRRQWRHFQLEHTDDAHTTVYITHGQATLSWQYPSIWPTFLVDFGSFHMYAETYIFCIQQ